MSANQWCDKVEERALVLYPSGWLTVARRELRSRVRRAWNSLRWADCNCRTMWLGKEDIELIIDRIKLRQRAV